MGFALLKAHVSLNPGIAAHTKKSWQKKTDLPDTNSTRATIK